MPEVSTVPCALGKLLRAKRSDLGWSQSDLGRAAGFKQHTISEWESGVRPPTMASAIKLAEVLELDMNEIADAIKTDTPELHSTA